MKHIFSLVYLLVVSHGSIFSHDWEFYLDISSALKKTGVYDFFSAHRVAGLGIEKIEDTAAEDTNFDWQHYNERNRFSFATEAEALTHYKEIGHWQNLEYCKPFTMLICLHLYNLDLAAEFIDKINRFMRINDTNTYHIKITVPIGQNIASFAIESPEILLADNEAANIMREAATYHPELITKSNIQKLYAIYTYLKHAFSLDAERVQIIFSENRGADIGGFLLALDQIIQQNIEHDFIMKIHSKTTPGWRNLLTSFMNIRINKLLRNYNCIYSCRRQYKMQDNDKNKKDVTIALHALGLHPYESFDYSAGTMFIVPNAFTYFYEKLDRLQLFNMLNNGFPKHLGPLLEHAFEITFGVIIEHLKLRPCVLDYSEFSPIDMKLNYH